MKFYGTLKSHVFRNFLITTFFYVLAHTPHIYVLMQTHKCVLLQRDLLLSVLYPAKISKTTDCCADEKNASSSYSYSLSNDVILQCMCTHVAQHSTGEVGFLYPLALLLFDARSRC